MNILYSSISSVRAVLGLSSEELPSSNVEGLDLATLVELELDLIYPQHLIVHAAVEGGLASPEQARIFKVLKLFCGYQAAVFLLPQLQMLVVQSISDGDAENSRFSPNDLETMKYQIRGRLQHVKEILNPSIAIASGLVSVLIGVQPNFDPVTNVGA
jgi:hypothetical protein